MLKRICALCAILVLAGCGNSSEESNNGTNNGANNGATNASNNGTNGQMGSNNGAEGPTYYEDVKPIIDAKCAECHTAGAIGPFSLTTYDEVFAVKELVRNEVETKTMPPFIYDTQCRDYTHDPTLKGDELDTIVAWVDAGAPEGDASKEGAAITVERPESPTFDTVLPMPVDYTPRQSPDDYRCFIVDWPHDTTKYVTGFGVEPGEDTIVHHVIAFLAPPSSVAEAQALDDAEEGPGYTCFGTANISDQAWMGSWAPGGVPAKFAPGSGIPVEPGSKMIIQVHYNTLIEQPRPDKTTVQFETADTVERAAIWMPWANPIWLNGLMKIGAGNPDVMHQFAYDPTNFIGNGVPLKVWGAGLHMHLLGQSIKAWIQRADGSKDCLVDSPAFDFNWQQGVMFDQPVTLNPGDKLALECHWDNSMANQPLINGERSAPEDRNWGEGTRDEMCLGVFYVTY